MTFRELVMQLEAWRDEGRRLGAVVPLETIATEVLGALRELELADADLLTIQAAAELGGYSEDHLRREIAAGRIPNAGRKHKPAIRRADVPRKPGHTALPNGPGDGQLSPRRRIVLEATTTPPRSA
jgi:hypothetical protein